MFAITAWKRIGETPLQTLQRVTQEFAEQIPAGIKSCYTCRLDPMAQGEITLLYGDAVHQAKFYNSREKTYRFQAILGYCTDSYDAMGRIRRNAIVTYKQALEFSKELSSLSGAIRQKLPAYSAYRYKGKPLWKHAVDGTLPDVMPSRTVAVHSVISHFLPVKIPVSKYVSECTSDILDVQSLNPDSFQYSEILAGWASALEKGGSVYRIMFTAHVASGTYIRSLVHDTGEKLGIPAHAFRITRTLLHKRGRK